MSIHEMLSHKLVHIGDTVYFTFKGNQFNAKIIKGGLIADCTIMNDGKTKPILTGVTAFSSLTAWTEACLQDVLEEYYTRYSSWKRVHHKESKRTMGDLRDQCKLLTKKRKRDEEVPELYKEIYRLQQTIVDMKQHILKWQQGETPEPKDWKIISIRPNIPITGRVNEAKQRLQFIALGEPRGIDLELYQLLK